MPDPEINPGQPAAPTPPTPEPAQTPEPGVQQQTLSPAEIAALREENAALARERERMNRAYTQLAQAALANTPAPAREATPAAAPPPDREEDPDAYIEYMVKKRVEETLSSQVAPVVNQYRQDRAMMFSSQVDQQRLNLRNSPEHPGFADVEKEVMEYAAQFAPEILAQPGALSECYWRVMGRRAAAEAAQAHQRSQSRLETGGRGSAPSEPGPAKQELTDLEKRVAAGAGLTDAQFKALQGAGRMDIDDWRKLNAPPATGGRK